MKITDKRENKEKFLTLEDLNIGEVFSFLSDDEIYMLLDNKDYVDLADGTRYEIDDHEYTQAIEWLNAELIIHRRLE